ncbi:hypothetical protein ACFX5K_06120 [Rickettsiales bacterium LUAb2]
MPNDNIQCISIDYLLKQLKDSVDQHNGTSTLSISKIDLSLKCYVISHEQDKLMLALPTTNFINQDSFKEKGLSSLNINLNIAEHDKKIAEHDNNI